MNQEKNKKAIVGLVLNATALALAKKLKSVDSRFSGGVITELIGATVGNYTTKHFESFGIYDKLFERIKKKHPDDLNHDIERIIKEAALVAITLLKVIYKEELANDVGFFINCDKNEIKKYFSSIDSYFAYTHEELKKHFEATKITKKIIRSSQDYFTPLSEYLIGISNVKFDPTSKERLLKFHIEHLPVCFQLAFKEVLKNDDKGYKSFQLWVLEDIITLQRRSGSEITKIQQTINKIKRGLNVLSYKKLDEFGKELTKRLDTRYADLHRSFKESLNFIKENFESQYSISLQILDKVSGLEKISRDLKDITTSTKGLVEISMDTGKTNLDISIDILNHVSKITAGQHEKEGINVSQKIFSKSSEILKLIKEIEDLPVEIQRLKSSYESINKSFEANPTPEYRELMEVAQQRWIDSTEKLKSLHSSLDSTKSTVLSLYHLLYKQENVNYTSDTIKKAISLFQQGKFADLEKFLSSNAREKERDLLLRQQKLLDEKKRFGTR